MTSNCTQRFYVNEKIIVTFVIINQSIHSILCLELVKRNNWVSIVFAAIAVTFKVLTWWLAIALIMLISITFITYMSKYIYKKINCLVNADLKSCTVCNISKHGEIHRATPPQIRQQYDEYLDCNFRPIWPFLFNCSE